MIAARLSAVWQVGAVAAAALCCYLVSQSVAAERAGLLKVDRAIAKTQDDIARLNTELGTRGRMEQLESWNTNVLELKAPKPAQFVAGGAQLVALYARGGRPALPLDPTIVAQQGDTTKVAYQQPKPAPEAAPVEAEAAPAPAQPMLRTATYVRPKPARLEPEVAPPVEKAAYVPDEPVKPAKHKPVLDDAPAVTRVAYIPDAPVAAAKRKPVLDDAPAVTRVAYIPDAPVVAGKRKPVADTPVVTRVAYVAEAPVTAKAKPRPAKLAVDSGALQLASYQPAEKPRRAAAEKPARLDLASLKSDLAGIAAKERGAKDRAKADR